MVSAPLSVTLRTPCFLHWPVDPAAIAAVLPDGLEPETHDGRAWVSVVALVMADASPQFVPVGRTFPSLNCRTFVRADGVSGVYFLSLDAADRLGVAVARRLFGMPYHRATMDVSGADGRRRFRSERVADGTRFDLTYASGAVRDPAADGSLEAFLLERYRFLTVSERGRRAVGRIDHDPWPLREVTVDVETNEVFAAAGLDVPDRDPLAHYSPGVRTTFGVPRRL
ncbi:MAG: YqjF family protein [Haloarculaceae archaeon]